MERSYGLEAFVWFRVPEEKPEAMGEDTASVAVEAPGYWRGQEPGMINNNRHSWEVEPTWEKQRVQQKTEP